MPAIARLRLDSCIVDDRTTQLIEPGPGPLPGDLRRLATSCLGASPDSGCARLQEGRAALVARLALARHASRTLDVQYYLWHDDATGWLLARALLEAADRGVRVRMLIDDIHLAGRETGWAALDRHRNIDIRIFNPFRVRAWPSLRRLVEVLREGARLNHRMHNKAFVADQVMAIVGGRNIGDEYFAASETANFRDMDLLALGPVVHDISRSFESFWQSSFSVPVGTVATVRPTRRIVRRWYRKLRRFRLPKASLASYAELNADRLLEELRLLLQRIHRGSATAIFDLPEKAGGVPGARLAPAIVELAAKIERELLLESAYFIPDDPTMKMLAALRERGVEVTVLTNSLASNDVIAAHAGYAIHRRSLLGLGIRLFEVRGRVARQSTTVSGSEAGPQASLHSKAAVIDRRIVFIGTLNFDPRSLYINTEIALVVHSDGLAKEVATVIERALDGATSYRVSPEGRGYGGLRWRAAHGVEGDETWDSEPEAGRLRKLLSWLYQRAPFHHWL
jgi:putative cardiolipin synthase